MRLGVSFSRKGWLVAAGLLAALALPQGCTKKPPPAKLTRYTTLKPKQVPAFMKGTIYEHAELIRTEGLAVSGFGLVANLDGTGDSSAPAPVREYISREMVKHKMGSALMPGMRDLTPARVLSDPRVAIVEVRAVLPPGVRKGQRFDVEVAALPDSNTTSIARGQLWQTDLRVLGANYNDPGGAVNVYARGEGPIFSNPAYALNREASDPAARRSLRVGIVMDGAHALEDRPLGLRLLEPQHAMARRIERRIDERFQKVADHLKPNNVMGMAEAQDEGVVNFFVPQGFDGDWEHFAGLVTHLYLYDSPEFAVGKAKELADEAEKPDAPLLDISYCWEGLGAPALAVIHDRKLMASDSPEVAFAAARAAAFLGEPTAPEILARMAQTPDHPFQLAAIRALGDLPPSPHMNKLMRPLLDSEQTLARIEAWRMLARNEDSSIFSRAIKDRFRLDIVTSKGPPVIYATRRGGPRIAIFGARPQLDLPATCSLMGGRLTISSDESNRSVTIFYRPPGAPRGGAVPPPVKVVSRPDVAELVARLGGEGPEQEPALPFNYGEVVAILSSLSDAKKLTAIAEGIRIPASFVLQELPQVRDSVYGAPAIGGGARPENDVPSKEVGLAK